MSVSMAFLKKKLSPGTFSYKPYYYTYISYLMTEMSSNFIKYIYI